jgi:hypothetical protein
MGLTLAGNGTLTGVDPSASGLLSEAGGTGSNVVQTVLTSAFSASLNGSVRSSAVLAATITPTSATSKILVIVSPSIAISAAEPAFDLFRGGSVISTFIGDSGAAERGTGGMGNAVGSVGSSISFTALDSPGVATAVTYDIRLFHTSGVARTVYLNRGPTDSIRTVSTLTLIEVAA